MSDGGKISQCNSKLTKTIIMFLLSAFPATVAAQPAHSFYGKRRDKGEVRKAHSTRHALSDCTMDAF